MESVTKEMIVDFLQNNEIDLAPTQTKLCVPVINRIYKKMSVGIKFSGIKVDNNVICDGHHRYIASLLANFPIETVPGRTTSATITTHWKSISLEIEEWDTDVKVRMLNEQDAEFNNIPIDELVALLK